MPVPIMSAKVVIRGVLAVAGSFLSFTKIKGSKTPMRDPTIRLLSSPKSQLERSKYFFLVRFP